MDIFRLNNRDAVFRFNVIALKNSSAAQLKAFLFFLGFYMLLCYAVLHLELSKAGNNAALILPVAAFCLLMILRNNSRSRKAALKHEAKGAISFSSTQVSIDMNGKATNYAYADLYSIGLKNKGKYTLPGSRHSETITYLLTFTDRKKQEISFEVFRLPEHTKDLEAYAYLDDFSIHKILKAIPAAQRPLLFIEGSG